MVLHSPIDFLLSKAFLVTDVTTLELGSSLRTRISFDKCSTILSAYKNYRALRIVLLSPFDIPEIAYACLNISACTVI